MSCGELIINPTFKSSTRMSNNSKSFSSIQPKSNHLLPFWHQIETRYQIQSKIIKVKITFKINCLGYVYSFVMSAFYKNNVFRNFTRHTTICIHSKIPLKSFFLSKCKYSNLNLTCLSECWNISGCQAQSLHLSHKCAAWRVGGGYFFIKSWFK